MARGGGRRRAWRRAAASATSAACGRSSLLYVRGARATRAALSTAAGTRLGLATIEPARSASSRAANSTASAVVCRLERRAARLHVTGDARDVDSRARDSASKRRVPAPPARTDRLPSRRRSSRRRFSRDERRRPHLLGGFRPRGFSRGEPTRDALREPAQREGLGGHRRCGAARARDVASITSSCLAGTRAPLLLEARAGAKSSPCARVRTTSGKPSRRPPRPRSRRRRASMRRRMSSTSAGSGGASRAPRRDDMAPRRVSNGPAARFFSSS